MLPQASLVKPFPLQYPNWTDLRSNLAYCATIIIKKNNRNASRLVNTSRKESLFFSSPAWLGFEALRLHHYNFHLINSLQSYESWGYFSVIRDLGTIWPHLSGNKKP